MKPKITLREAAAALGKKGGKTTGKSKARLGTSAQVKKWWASPAAAARRKTVKAPENPILSSDSISVDTDTKP
jgi:hypothetical protein